MYMPNDIPVIISYNFSSITYDKYPPFIKIQPSCPALSKLASLRRWAHVVKYPSIFPRSSAGVFASVPSQSRSGSFTVFAFHALSLPLSFWVFAGLFAHLNFPLGAPLSARCWALNNLLVKFRLRLKLSIYPVNILSKTPLGECVIYLVKCLVFLFFFRNKLFNRNIQSISNFS